jgi:hypothetical protein
VIRNPESQSVKDLSKSLLFLTLFKVIFSIELRYWAQIINELLLEKLFRRIQVSFFVEVIFLLYFTYLLMPNSKWSEPYSSTNLRINIKNFKKRSHLLNALSQWINEDKKMEFGSSSSFSSHVGHVVES